MHRRLAAILAADVVGYSRLVRADEAGTLAALKALKADLLDREIEAHGGRLFKEMGDGFLVEFPSAVEAVSAAAAIQGALAKESAGPLRLRIGITLGDVIVDGEDLLGDGVNLAARLESIAQAGSVCVSDLVHEQVRDRLDLAFTDLGLQSLKNIDRPLRVWQWSPGANTPVAADAAPSVPAKLSIAVLRFTNMSADPEQAYFSDGVTEDIITELSRFPDLFVIARNLSFKYSGEADDIRQAGAALGARFIVEGSVRRAGNRVRVTAQLIEAAEGSHLWAERYDRDLEDIFAVQDEVVRQIVGAIPGRLRRRTLDEVRRKHPGNLTAYDCELRGRWALTHWNEGIAKAVEWFERAGAADPDYALAHAGIAMANTYGLYALGGDMEATMARAKTAAQRALVLDDRNPVVAAYAAFTYHVGCEPELALRQSEKAVALNPNDPFVIYVRACALTYGGAPDEALEWFARSAALEPYAADDQRLDTLCDCCYMVGDYRRVIEIHSTYQHVPAFLNLILAAACAQAGEPEKVAAALAAYQQSRPPEHDAATMIKFQLSMCLRAQDREHWREGYRLAGLPA